MTRKKEIETFIEELKNVRVYGDCEDCPISSYNIYSKKYKFLDNAISCCSAWYYEVTGISVLGQGCFKVIDETIKHFTKVLRRTEANKI